MNHTIVSVREIQRHYRKLINRVKKTRQPLYIGARLKPEAVLLDADTFTRFARKERRGTKSWQEIKRTLEWIRSGGKQNVNLARFIHEDRERHER